MNTWYIIYLINVLSLLNPAVSQPARCQALMNLNTMIDARNDFYINKYYHQIVESERTDSLLFRFSFSDKVTIPPRAFILLMDRSKHDMIEAAQLLYVCRRQWWGNKAVQAYMTKRIIECYPAASQKSITELNEKELKQVFCAIQCYGYAGRKSYKLPLLFLLGDKRVVVNHDPPGLGYDVPRPSRVCDAVLYSLMMMYEVDSVAVGEHYGYPFSVLPRNRPFQERVLEAYDRMLKDFGSLNERFFE